MFFFLLLGLLVNLSKNWNKISRKGQRFNELLHGGILSDVSLCVHQVIKEDLERAYKNTNMKPMSHSTYLRLQVLREIFWDVDEKLEVLMNLTFTDLVKSLPKILSQVCSQWPPPRPRFIFCPILLLTPFLNDVWRWKMSFDSAFLIKNAFTRLLFHASFVF